MGGINSLIPTAYSLTSQTGRSVLLQIHGLRVNPKLLKSFGFKNMEHDEIEKEEGGAKTVHLLSRVEDYEKRGQAKGKAQTAADAPKQTSVNPISESMTADNRHTEILKILLAEVQVIESAIHAYQAQQNDNVRREKRKFWIQLLTLAAIVLYAGVTLLIWREVVSTGKQTNELIEIAANQSGIAKTLAENTTSLAEAAKDQAQAAIDQVKELKASVKAASIAASGTQDAAKAARINADAGTAGVKAWIAYDRLQIATKASQVIWTVVFRNVGKTPALDVATGWEFRFLPSSVREQKFESCPTGQGSRPGLVAADQGWSTEITATLTDAQLKLLNDKTARLWVHGCATFFDILDTQKRRFTEVAFIYPPLKEDLGAATVYAPYNRMQ
jgi:hypothetical protein